MEKIGKKIINILTVTGVTPGGGVATFINNINDYIDKENYKLEFIFSEDSNTSRFIIDKDNSDVHLLPSLEAKNIFLFFKQLSKFYQQNANRFDIIHIHSPNIALPHLYYAKKYGVKVRIMHSHSIQHSNFFYKKIRNYLLSLFNNKYSNVYLACSKVAGNFLFKNRNFIIINNGINISKYKFKEEIRHKIRTILGIESNFVLGHIGNFFTEKNHQFIIAIFQELLKLKPNSKLMLIGAGYLRKDIERKVTELNILDKVIFLGQRNDVNELLQAMDGFIFPSLFEGLGFVLIEAQTAGVKCFASTEVPIEAKLTDLVEYIPLSESAAYWANKIVASEYNYQRDDYCNLVKDKGYDLKDSIKTLEKIYQEKIREYYEK